jgi:hypothetical protein
MVREIVKKKTKRFERCGGAERSLTATTPQPSRTTREL